MTKDDMGLPSKKIRKNLCQTFTHCAQNSALFKNTCVMFCTRFCYITLESTQLDLFALNCIFCTQLHLFTLNFIYMHSIAFICTQLDLFALNWMYSYHNIEFCDSVQNLPKNVLPPAKMVCSTQLASSIFVTRMRTTKVALLSCKSC